jgi:hypothetical protein
MAAPDPPEPLSGARCIIIGCGAMATLAQSDLLYEADTVPMRPARLLVAAHGRYREAGAISTITAGFGTETRVASNE